VAGEDPALADVYMSAQHVLAGATRKQIWEKTLLVLIEFKHTKGGKCGELKGLSLHAATRLYSAMHARCLSLRANIGIYRKGHIVYS